MTQLQKLDALIQKAMDSGWSTETVTKESFSGLISVSYMDAKVDLKSGYTILSHLTTIFNHEFAKSLWREAWPGSEKTNLNYRGEPMKRWQYNLAQMVLADNPIDYLYKSVFPD